MKKTRIIQVGLGVMGRNWAQGLAGHHRVELAAWVDENIGALRDYDPQGPVDQKLRFHSYDEAFSKVEAKAVIVATPPELHEAVCVAAMKRGLHVLCEKPLAHTYASARRITEAAGATGRLLMVAQNRRHAPFIHGMRDLVAAGAYGRPTQTWLTFHHHFTRDSYRDTMLHPLLLDMANHHFDTLRFVLGREPVGVQGLAWKPIGSRFQGPAAAVLVFDYTDGLRATYQGNWSTVDVAKTSNGCDWRIECPGGLIACHNELVSAGPAGGVLAAVELPAMPHTYGAYLLEEFLTCIDTGQPPGTSGEDNLKTLELVFGAIEAVNSGVRVALSG